MSRGRDAGKRSFSNLLGLSGGSGEESEHLPVAKEARTDKDIPLFPKLSAKKIFDKVGGKVYILKDRVNNLEEEVGTLRKNCELGTGAEERIKRSVTRSTILKLNKTGFASEETVVKAFTKLSDREERDFSGLQVRVVVLDKKEPAKNEGEDRSSSKLREKVQEFEKRVIKTEERIDGFDTLKEDIISEATSEGKDFNHRLANQFVNAFQLKTLLTDFFKKVEEKNQAELYKVEEGFKAEIKALKATINENPKLEACEATVLKHNNNIRACAPAHGAARREQRPLEQDRKRGQGHRQRQPLRRG